MIDNSVIMVGMTKGYIIKHERMADIPRLGIQKDVMSIMIPSESSLSLSIIYIGQVNVKLEYQKHIIDSVFQRTCSQYT